MPGGHHLGDLPPTWSCRTAAAPCVSTHVPLVLHVTCAAWAGCRHRHRAGGWDCASISSKLLRCISHYDSNNLHGLLLHICIVGDGLSVLDVMAVWPFGLKCASKPRPPAFLVLAHCALHPHAVGLHRRHPHFGEHDLCACTHSRKLCCADCQYYFILHFLIGL